MYLISPALGLVAFGIILVVAIVIALWMRDYQSYDKNWFHSFIAILTGLGVFVTFLFYYNIIVLQQEQQQSNTAEELARINSLVLTTMLESINQSSHVIPNFVLSITPLTNEVCCNAGTGGSTGTTGGTGLVCTIPVGPDPVNPQTCTEKYVLSYRIFSLFQEIILNKHKKNMEAEAYISNFLQRTNSPQLFAQWTVNRINFQPKTQTFGDLLFEYGLPITVQTPQEYTATAQKLMADPRYQELIGC